MDRRMLGMAAIVVISAHSSYAVDGDVVQRLTEAVRYELESKQIPALSLALVDGDRIVWAAGFGQERTHPGAPADEHTVYRVGSISKLFADIAALQLVEQGRLSLDAPITQYLPEWRPRDPFEVPITLRQLMSHRAGIVREPPVGHYFDPTEPTLAETVQSLNRTALVYQPETRTKYSNAGVAVVGRLVEQISGQPFAPYVEERLLRPLGMTSSSFVLTPAVRARLAEAVMWGYDGREFPAPQFALGTVPAGNLYSSVHDQALFLRALWSDDGRKLLRPETLAAMWVPQFVPADQPNYGLGFHVSRLDDARKIGHGGAVYGCAAQLAALPDERLGVIVAASRDVVNGPVARLADYALRLLRAERRGEALPSYPRSAPLPAGLARELAGRFADGDSVLDFQDVGDRLYVVRGVYRREVRGGGEGFILDDPFLFGPALRRLDADRLEIDGRVYTRQPQPEPPEPPERWRGLIGAYGWDHNTLFILEDRGRLWALIEWCFYYPLTELGPSEFAFPDDYGLYHGEKLIFRRDAAGRATHVVAADVKFVRRDDDHDGQTFRLRPLEPVADLRRRALAAQPPVESNHLRKPDLVDLMRLEPTLKFDMRYATDNNFLSTPFYSSARAFLQRPAAEGLLRAHQNLQPLGYGLLIHDAYRPWHVTRMFYDATPAELKHFVADPAKGSRHNRGCAVDLTLYDLRTGAAVRMPSGYDEFSPRAYPAYPGGSSRARWLRELLRRTLEAEGFRVYEHEWWHFDFSAWREYPLLNLRFEELPGT